MDNVTQLKSLEDAASDPFALVDRPSFVVLDSWTKGNPPGLYYCWIKPGGKFYPDTDFNTWISLPLHVEAVTHDNEGHNFGRMLRFTPTVGKSKMWAMAMELLKGDCAELRGILLDMGFEITTDRKMRDKLPEFIQRQHPETVLKCVAQTGWVNSNCFVLPAKTYGSESVVFQSPHKNHNEFNQLGFDFEWKEQLAALAVGNPMLTLAISTGFAAPLLEIVGGESGGIHFTGDSSTGKTTLLLAACSIWGGDSYKRSWRATANGLEGVAAMFNDGFLALDEISECDPNEIGSIIYSLGNGQGKQRANRVGNARSVARWRCIILSTGERTIETSMREGRRRIKAGQALRLVDLNVECQYGVFDNLHGYETGAALAEAIKAACKEFHGTAGDLFLEKLVKYRSDGGKFELPVFEASDGQQRRVANRFALVAFAGELATQFEVTGWESGMATDAARAAFKRWQDAQPHGRNEEAKIVEALARFVEAHGDARFAEDGYSSNEPMIRDRAGFKDSHGFYFFLSGGLQEALREFDFDRAKDVLFDKGILKNRVSRQKKVNGTNFKVYEIDSSRLYP